MIIRKGLIALAALVLAPLARAQEAPAGKTYPDGRGGQVVLPLGDLSFADDVVSFKRGTPSAAESTALAISKDTPRNKAANRRVEALIIVQR